MTKIKENNQNNNISRIKRYVSNSFLITYISVIQLSAVLYGMFYEGGTFLLFHNELNLVGLCSTIQGVINKMEKTKMEWKELANVSSNTEKSDDIEYSGNASFSMEPNWRSKEWTEQKNN